MVPLLKKEKTVKSKLGTTVREYEDGVERLQWFKLTDPQVSHYVRTRRVDSPSG
jgi:hypothetical protein